MAYSVLPTKNTGDPITLTNWNNIRDNFIAGVPDLYTTKGDLAPATGGDAAARLAVGANHARLVADSGEAVGMRWQPFPVVALTKTADQDPATDTWVDLTWDSENVDSNGMHDNATNNERITCVSGGDGLYLVNANIGFDTSTLTPGASGQYGVRLRLNGLTTLATWFDEAEMQSQDLWIGVPYLPGLTATDYVTVQVWTSRDVNILSASTFWAIYERTN